jgi:dipeptidyl-peptidase-4
VADSFPRQNARTRNFTLGAPRSFAISPDGATIVFLRSRGSSDPVTCLWALDVATGHERLVVNPAELARPGTSDDPVEKARRERVRERAGGIVAFATDTEFSVAAFTLAGVVYLADLRSGGARPLATAIPAADPRPAPDGGSVAYVSGGALRLAVLTRGTTPAAPAATDTSEDRLLADPEGAGGVTFGLPDFIAAEEFGRTRGFWWAPDGSALLVARVDEMPVQTWHIADPANPGTTPAAVRYPSAGTANAVVTLFVVTTSGKLTAVDTDHLAFPYLITASWDRAGEQPLVVVLSRDQREMRLLSVDQHSGACTIIRSDTDPSWVDVVRGVPARTTDGRIVWTADSGGAKRLLAGTAGQHATGTAPPVTGPDLQVREVLSVDGDTILFTASAEDPASTAVWSAGPGGVRPVSPAEGMHSGQLSGGTLLLAGRTIGASGADMRVLRPGGDGSLADARTGQASTGQASTGQASTGQASTGQASTVEVGRIGSLAEQPRIPAPQPTLGYSAGQARLRTAILLPSWHEPGSAKLPVLCDPYGGPHAQRVTSSRDAYLTSQWFAEQGFAVVIADGRGTPGRGPRWDRAVAGDLATPPLEDQVEALHGAAERCADLDLSRVAIRGWSFGGFLSALAVLRRPDVFHAGIAGAPVTDWRLYDTGYTERYLGHPDFSPDAYDRSSLLGDAAGLTRPLMIIHGLADDNVVVAHSLRLSSALLAAGRPHTVLPLSGVTHMASQEEVAENLLLLQVDFLRSALGITEGRRA